MSLVDDAPSVQDVKARFRAAYREWLAHGDNYTCGNALLIHVSEKASRIMREMVDALDALAVADPDFPDSLRARVEQWRAMVSGDSETSVAVQELNQGARTRQTRTRARRTE